MAQIVFYEKPGCINNTRQKKLLRQAGHTVIAKDLLAENWADKPEQLRAFFLEKRVPNWFNRSAPLIKQGAINPDEIDADQAIALMVTNPLLIRRPLMQVGAEKMCGFEETEVDNWIGLSGNITGEELEKCPRTESETGHSHA